MLGHFIDFSVNNREQLFANIRQWMQSELYFRKRNLEAPLLAGLEERFSKRGSQTTSSISIWQLVKNVNSLSLPSTFPLMNQKLWRGDVFHTSSRVFQYKPEKHWSRWRRKWKWEIGEETVGPGIYCYKHPWRPQPVLATSGVQSV